MFWSNVKLIFLRELRDQLRDRRTLFAVVGLPLLLYPLMGVLVFHVQQFLKEHKSKVRVIGEAAITMQPPLVQDGRLVGRYDDNSRLELEVVRDWRGSLEELTARSQTDIRLGLCDAVVYLPPDFGASGEASQTDEGRPPASEIIYDAARDKSRVARQRIEAALLAWREALQRQHQPAQATPPRSPYAFDLKQTDVAPVARRHAALWSKILPFVVLIWALTGAFYPAVDLCAGEKERGTLETLLTSPAGREEIVWGKLLTIMTFSIATALLNMASMAATGGFVVSHLQRAGASRLPLDLGAPPLAALVWLVVALLPIAALFSALALAIAAFARSSKEGHYYLLPLLMISLPLMLLSLFPGVELDLGFALIPLTGMLLWLRALIEGQYLEALRFGVPVFVMTDCAACSPSAGPSLSSTMNR
jgi:sodium transport system permease protein